ncbi:hypothetical protein [Facilibium subflavum]|uniref:hypothetical protein n=1 Tax=Facilibium subflavum TaxID=2219058 RepID=UPI000E658874|nr:hypothetical protein [Facilibium subflavum]
MKKAWILSIFFHLLVAAIITVIFIYQRTTNPTTLNNQTTLQPIYATVIYVNSANNSSSEEKTKKPDATQHILSKNTIVTKNGNRLSKHLLERTHNNQEKPPSKNRQHTSTASVAAHPISTKKQLLNTFRQLEQGLFQTLKQYRPEKSIQFTIAIMLTSSGMIKSIKFHPLPDHILQNIIMQYLHQQKFTRELVFEHETSLSIPVVLQS